MTENAPDVSVVVAAFNCAGFVNRAIGSALAQEGVSIEVLVVDDASTDDTAAAVAAVAAGDPRLKLIALEKNGGPAVARNAGFAAARGEWVAVLDADDAFEPDRLRRLVSLGRDAAADMLADNFRNFDTRTGKSGSKALFEKPESELLDRYAFLRGARPYTGEGDFGLLKPVFRRAFVADRSLQYPAQSRHGEDFLFYLEIVLQGGRFLLLRGESGYLYTTRDSGLSRTVIDYGDQLRQLALLAQRPDLAGDSELLALLQARADALTRLAAEQELQLHIRSKDAAELLRFALRNSWNRTLAARWAGKAIARKGRLLAQRVLPTNRRDARWS